MTEEISRLDNPQPLRIAILGTRGIPNNYGGFEQFAEYLAVGLKERGHDVAVYIPHFHPYKKDEFKGVRLHRVISPERLLGAAANFLYDYLCLRDAIKRGYDIALECGYGTLAPSLYLVRPKKTRIITNMDGLEWKRSKWSPMVQRLMLIFEGMTVRRSHALVADNIGIQEYLKNTYGIDSTYIPYGADLVENPPIEPLEDYQVELEKYFLVIARLEPENNLEMIINGYRTACSPYPLLIIGNHMTSYGHYLKKIFADTPSIRFLGGIYKKQILDSLRHHARIYFHGHSVGGTNPSLLEAMGCGSMIAAHDNEFNRSVANKNALYFSDSLDITNLINTYLSHDRQSIIQNNFQLLKNNFAWQSIIQQYEDIAYKKLINTEKITKTSALLERVCPPRI